MARQSGIIKIEGKIGGMSFYGQGGSYLVRQAGGVSGNRIRTDPAFKRTRENQAEFGEAGRQGKLLRTAFRNALAGAPTGASTAKLTQRLVRVVQSDTANGRGERKVSAGDLSLLEGFEFNVKSGLDTTLFSDLSLAFDDTGEELTFSSSIVPNTDVSAPEGATHFRVKVGVASLDFDGSKQKSAVAISSEYPVSGTTAQSVSLTAGYDKSVSAHTLAMVGIEFLQEVNGVMYPLRNGAFNALRLQAYHEAV
ncbi:hypothetical protein FUAX_52810 (plasmid) [Fulvitalea axinellae]|uniref:Uncharacterized protein n=1 Tax=Fulvitalea axinellae TaxID=1182444 RepID=A0AAU9D2P2_9BACT|nr:hypothetical protein FUAX_52810 [Fulvitalea axinellae]